MCKGTMFSQVIRLASTHSALSHSLKYKANQLEYVIIVTPANHNTYKKALPITYLQKKNTAHHIPTREPNHTYKMVTKCYNYVYY